MSPEKMAQRLEQYPAISDLQKRAAARVPHIGWEYLSMGTGDDESRRRNLTGLSDITLLPQFMKGRLTLDLTTPLFDRTYAAPFGVAPVGLGGLIWPGAEEILAESANRYGVPYCLSTVATQTPEVIGPIAGRMGWFQLYPPRDLDVRTDLLKRAWDNGMHTLVVTADVPAPSRRQRASRAGMRMPPRLTPRFVLQGAVCPEWAFETLKRGLPTLLTVAKYAEGNDLGQIVEFMHKKMGGALSWDYLREVREAWQGRMIVKGILHPADAQKAVDYGLDGVQVSNHGGRQLDGAPAAIDALPLIVEQVKGKAAILFDSGVRSGLDIIRALALGADFVFLGRAFMFGVGAFGQDGGDIAMEILLAEMKADMHNLGVGSIAEVKELVTGRSSHRGQP